MLAGVINGPEYYSPFKDIKAAKQRQKIVLDAMVHEKQITQQQANQAYQSEFKTQILIHLLPSNVLIPIIVIRL